MLRIDTRHANDVLVLDVTGRLSSGVPENLFTGAIRSAIDHGDRRILVNLDHARSADASGLSALLAARLDARNAGAELRLANVERFAELLTLTAVYTSFDVYESEDDALASFARPEFGPVMPVAEVASAAA